MSLPNSLLYFCDRLSGFSTNYFQIESQNQTSAKAGQIVTFDLPANSILNLPSFTVHFNATTANSADATGAILPPVRDLFERIEVSCGGVILSQGANFANVMARARDALLGSSLDPVTGHALIVRNQADYKSYFLQGSENEAPEPISGQTFFAFHAYEMEGFMSTVDPKLFDSSIIPDLRVRLYMAPNSVLSASKNRDRIGMGSASFADQTEVPVGDDFTSTGPAPSKAYKTNVADAKYEITNIVGTIECISLADMTYENLLASTMQAQGYLEAPFKAYHSFQDTHSQTTRFSVASQSLDRVWVTWRPTDHAKVDTPIQLQTGQAPNGLHIQPTDDANRSVATYEYIIPEYKPRYMWFGEPVAYTAEIEPAVSEVPEVPATYAADGTTVVTPAVPEQPAQPARVLKIYDGDDWKMQLQLNGAYLPQYMANLQQLYEISTNSTEGRRKNEMSQTVYRHGNCVQCFRLNMPDSELSHTLSGLDTRAVNLAGFVKTVSTKTATCNVFVECTSTLRIGAGRAIELIV